MVEQTANWGFERRLREERRRLGLTQAELASHSGVSTATQVAYEQGARKPSLDYLVAFQSAQGDVWYVMFGVRADRHAAVALDWELYADIQAAVVDWCDRREIELSQRRLVEVARLLYDQFIAEGTVQPEAVERILKLVA